MTLTRIDFKPKQERRVRFADSVGLELASIFLFDLINLANYHKKAIAYSKPALSSSSTSCSGGRSSSSGSSSSSNSNLHSRTSSSNSSSSSSSSKNNNNNNNYNHYSTSSGSKTNNPSFSNNHHHNHYAQKSHATTALTNCNSHLSTQPSILHRPPPQRPPSSFSCQFIQPISLLSFKERVKINKIHLETCQISVTPSASSAGAPAPEPPQVSATIAIRVLNCSYNKAVTVRYTTDEWRTHRDLEAAYVPNSSDGWSDKFSLTFKLTDQVKALEVGQRIIFCLRYVFDGVNTHWDNNGGLNYSIKVS